VSGARERLVVLLLGVVGAGLALLTAGRSWLTVVVSDPLVGTGRLHPDGRAVASIVPAAALVGLAAAVAAVTMRRIGRQVAGFLLVVAGAAIAAAAVSVLRDPRAAAAESAGAATGRPADVHAVASATVTIWPWIALLAGVPLVLAGAFTLLRGRRWSGLSGKYDAPAGSGAPGAADEPGDAGPHTESGAEADAASEADADDTAVGDAAADAWDAVSRGEDPTR
jgi:uncharacterized membrane protein (TIGR02234 family)